MHLEEEPPQVIYLMLPQQWNVLWNSSNSAHVPMFPVPIRALQVAPETGRWRDVQIDHGLIKAKGTVCDANATAHTSLLKWVVVSDGLEAKDGSQALAQVPAHRFARRFASQKHRTNTTNP